VAKNCCTFTSKFCTQSGQIVVGKMKLQDGVFSIEYYDLSGLPYANGDIIFPNCSAEPPTHFVDTEVSFINISCEVDSTEIRAEITFSDPSALRNGSLIELNIDAVSSILGSVNTFTIYADPLLGIVESNGKLLVIDSSLIIGQGAPFYIFGFPNSGCNATYSVDAIVNNISNLAPTWGNGTHTGNTIIEI